MERKLTLFFFEFSYARNKYGNADFFFKMNAQNLNMASGAGGMNAKN